VPAIAICMVYPLIILVKFLLLMAF